MQFEQIKVNLIGDAEVGKTALLSKLAYNENIDRYVSTLGVEVKPVYYYGYQINIWDCAGKEEFGGFRDGYYIDSNLAVVLYYKNNINREWDNIFHNVNPGKPIIYIKSVDTCNVNYGEVNIKTGKGLSELKDLIIQRIYRV